MHGIAKNIKQEAELLLQEAGLFTDSLYIQLPNPEQQNRHALSSKTGQSNYSFSGLSDYLEVYPNPADDYLTVEYIMLNGQTSNTISIFDINGRLMLSHRIDKDMDIVDINVSALSSGTYIITFGKEGSQGASTKFIVK